VLEGAIVKLSSPHHSQEVETNAFGRYNIKGVPSGEYTVHISHENYVGASNVLHVGGGITTQQDYTLEKGQSKLSVSAASVNATVVKGDFELQVLSNSDWTIETEADWITLSEQKGTDNKDVKITWEENRDPEERRADIILSAGELTIIIKVQQSFPSKLLQVVGKVGDILSTEKTRVDLLFNGAVSIKSITPLYRNCMGEPIVPTYQSANHRVSFIYSCGRLAGTYPFTLEWEDPHGNLFRDNFEVKFFDKNLEIKGMVMGRFLVPNEDKLWLTTAQPSKSYQIDIKTLEVLNEFAIGTSVFAPVITQNPYNQKLYISNNEYIDIYDPQTGKRISRVKLPPVENQAFMHHYVVEMAFNNAGMGILRVFYSGSSGSDWFIIDSTDNHRIYHHGRNGWNERQYHEVRFIKTSFNQKNIMIYGTGVDERGLIQTDEKIDALYTRYSMFESGTDAIGIHYSRTKERILLKHGGMDILDNGQLFQVPYMGFTPYVVEFALREDQVYAFDGDTWALHVIDYKNNNILKTFVTGEGLWSNIISTLDGEFLITETDNYGHNPNDESLTTKFFLFNTSDF